MKKIAPLLVATMILSLFSFQAFAADTASPGDVLNLKAAASLDGAVKLTWDKTTDDVAVTGYVVHYGKTSVTKQGQDYEKSTDVKNVQEYTVSGLTNGTKYYFSVTAYDAAGNESLNWAKEVSATPVKGTGNPAGPDAGADKIAPKVASAEAVNNQTVSVVFSEEVVLPKNNPQDAFDIEDQDKFEPLLVTGAKMDSSDKTNKTVVLTTSKQKSKASYKLTVGIDVKDKAGNPIVSGTSDTAIFSASDEEKAKADDKGPFVVKVESVDNTHFMVNFNEAIVLSIDPSEDFVITVEGSPNKKLDVLGVKLGTNGEGVEDASAIITTSPQEKAKYNVKAVNIKDEAGNKIDDKKNSGSFNGVAASTGGDLEDLLPPKDVLNFLAEKVLKGKQYTVKLRWKIPAENKDTEEQLVYLSTDQGKNYDDEATLDASDTQYDAEELDPGEYWFKITQKDKGGNESKGVIAKVVLSKTGPALAGLVAFSLFAGRIVTRRKNKK